MFFHPFFRAFTLIELLVVIAVIVVLIGMLIPSISSVRHSARSLNCANGQRQIAAAGFAYTSDNNGALPHSRIGSIGRKFWHSTLGIYLDAFDGNPADPTIDDIRLGSVFFCCKEGEVYNARTSSSSSMWAHFANSGIGMNYFPLGKGLQPGIGPASESIYNMSVPLAKVQLVSLRGFLACSTYYVITPSNSGPNGCPPSTSLDWVALGWKYQGMDPERHKRTANVAFFDGRVQSVNTASVYLTMWDPSSFR